MGISTPEEHAGRSAELQRLLQEADAKPVAPGQRRSRPAGRPRDTVRQPGAVVPSVRIPAERPGTATGTATNRVSSPPKNSALRSSPPATFPRRVTAAVPKSADMSNGDASRSAGGGSGRLRRSALVRSPLDGAASRRSRGDRSSDRAAVAGRVRGSGLDSSAARATGRTASTSVKSATARSLAGRWGAAGFSPEVPEHRAAVDPSFLPQDASRRPPIAGPNALAAAATRQPIGNEANLGGSPRTSADPATSAAGAGSIRKSTALPFVGRPRQRRTLVLAGGAAAAVVAIFAIVSLGNRGSSGPAAGSDPSQVKVAMVQTTGADGAPTMATVTAPVSTVNGRVVALVPDADGRLRQLTVVTATPPAAVTASSSPTATAPRSNSRPAGGGAATSPAVATTPTPSTTPTAVTATATSAPVTRPAAPTTANPAPADPGGDVATVITGLTTLTGWEPVTTG